MPATDLPPPLVSVVMSVYNGAEGLPATLESTLSQEGVDFEFIVVDDGSTDGSGDILDAYAARDTRLRVIHQANVGLTRALIRGCAQARGAFIARQDCGDVSLPGRLAKQVAALCGQQECVAVSCHTQFVGPFGEPLYTVEIDEARLNRLLQVGEQARYAGPSHHASMMFRRSAYEAVGGYRAAFYFAQDLDLWTRLIERGRFAVVALPLYQASLEPRSISGTQTQEQRQLAEIIAAATRARRSGGNEAPHLAAAAQVRPVRRQALPQRVALGYYFIGACLRRSCPRAAQKYFSLALAMNPWLWRARWRWLQAAVAGFLRTNS